MYDFIEGSLVQANQDKVVLMSGGVGYSIRPSQAALEKLPEVNNKAKLYVHLEVKEDDMTLYGFAGEGERKLFRLVRSVSRIGPKTALRILSAMDSDEIRQAVSREEENVLTSVKGIGKKTARRLILELKDKISDIDFEPQQRKKTNASMALQALTSDSLGFNGAEAREAINRIKKNGGDDLSVEEIIKKALKELS